MTPKLDSRDKDVTSGYCPDARRNKLACGHLRPHSPSPRRGEQDSWYGQLKYCCCTHRFGREILLRQPNPIAVTLKHATKALNRPLVSGANTNGCCSYTKVCGPVAFDVTCPRLLRPGKRPQTPCSSLEAHLRRAHHVTLYPEGTTHPSRSSYRRSMRGGSKMEALAWPGKGDIRDKKTAASRSS
jgi:hypothetical protein